MSSETEEIAREQQYVSALYDRLDALREQTATRFTRVLRESGGTPQQRTERDTAAAEHSDRLTQLAAAENGLCFGRLDLADDGTRDSDGDRAGDSGDGSGRGDSNDSGGEGDSGGGSNSSDSDSSDGGGGGGGPRGNADDYRDSGRGNDHGSDGGTSDGHRHGEHRYIGRIGMLDESTDYEPLLIDWRAPAARPFYIATAASPLGVRRRRHIKTRLRKVVGLDDDVLDLAETDGAASTSLVGEGALLAAVTAKRTGRMRDVVETIQVEQDHAIRAELPGVLVVQGGPGTGKTAVALHRAAYLLYTHRERLARRGVLIVGPNPTFLRYISHVLPALGETGAVLRTLGELFPGVTAQRPEPAEVAEIKGRPVMAEVIAAAVRAHQRVPDDTLKVVVDNVTYRLDRETCLDAREHARGTHEPHNLARPAVVERVLDALADQAMLRLNEDPFAEISREQLELISRDLRELGDPGDPSLEEELMNRHDRDEIRRALAQEPAVHEAIEWLWPHLTPQQLLTELYASPGLLDEVAPQLTVAERAALRRDPRKPLDPRELSDSSDSGDSSELSDLNDAFDAFEAADIDDVDDADDGDETTHSSLRIDSAAGVDSAAEIGSAAETGSSMRISPVGGWSVADVPLLDEAAELLGAPDAEAAAAEREHRAALSYAEGVMEILTGSTPIEREDALEFEQILTATDLITVEQIADQQAVRRHRTVAERAARDRSWNFGHVIVDEAQELSAMAWRALMRRCPSRSMTIVGDLAQTGDVAGASSWGSVLEPYVGTRWRMAELTVNYRTPAEVMALAAPVLARIDPRLEPPRSVRESGIEPWEETVTAPDLAARLGEIARREAALVGDGRLAVIVPSSSSEYSDDADSLAAAVVAALPDAAYGADPDLEHQTVVLTVRQAKGLEFDTVIVVDPAAVAAHPLHGDSDLYVALTRTTNRLGMIRVTGFAGVTGFAEVAGVTDRSN